MLLAAFVPARPGERVLELGCGAGAAALCLAARVPGLELHGLELQPAYAGLARRNAAENAAPAQRARGRPAPAAAGAARAQLRPRAGQPAVPRRRRPAAADPGRDRSHREAETTLADWIAAGLRRLVPGGRLVMIQRTARLAEILSALSGRAGSVEILPVASVRRPAGSALLVRARKDRAAPLTLWNALTVHEGRGQRGRRCAILPRCRGSCATWRNCCPMHAWVVPT